MGNRIPTALGIRTGYYRAPETYSYMYDATFPADSVTVQYGDEAGIYWHDATKSDNEETRKKMEANRRLLQQIYELQGYNGKPTVVSPSNLTDMLNTGDVKLIDGMPLVGLRVVNRVENQNDLFYGDTHHVPRQGGWFGTGTYFGVPRGKNPTKSPWMFANGLKILAQQLIASYSYPTGEYAYTRPADAPNINDRTPAIFMTALRNDARTNIGEIDTSNSDVVNESFKKWVKQLEKRFSGKYGRSTLDIGTMAAALGYDAIFIPHGVYGSSNEIMVFNRSKLIVTPLATGVNELRQKSMDIINDMFGVA